MHVWAKRFHFAVKLRYVCGETYWTLSTSLLCRKAALCAGSSHLAKVEQIVSSFLLDMWLGRSAHVVGGRETWLGLGDPQKEHVSWTCFCSDRAVSSSPYFSITSQIYSGFSVSFFFFSFFFFSSRFPSCLFEEDRTRMKTTHYLYGSVIWRSHTIWWDHQMSPLHP